MSVRRASAGDDGSVLLLAIGYAAIALVLVFVCMNATSLYLAQKRMDGIADAAALAGADGFTLVVGPDGARAELHDEEVRSRARAIVDAAGEAALVSAGTPDGASSRVVVGGVWHPPLLTLFVPDGVPLTATSTSRNALR